MSRRKIYGILIGLIVAVAALFAIFGMNSQDAAAPSTEQENAQTSERATETTPTDSTDTTSADTATIAFTDNGFNPQSQTVKQNSVVTVKNGSSEDLQFSSDDHPTHLKKSELNLKVLAPGESTTFTPTKIGTWGFHDHLDSSRTGTLVVSE